MACGLDSFVLVCGPDRRHGQRSGCMVSCLNKPAWTPPSWVFAPVWTTLYVLMGIAAWQVWERRLTTSVKRPIGMFLVQLVLNAAWSLIFFGLHRPDWLFSN